LTGTAVEMEAREPGFDDLMAFAKEQLGLDF
jgi:hypothetical protein